MKHENVSNNRAKYVMQCKYKIVFRSSLHHNYIDLQFWTNVTVTNCIICSVCRRTIFYFCTGDYTLQWNMKTRSDATSTLQSIYSTRIQAQCRVYENANARKSRPAKMHVIQQKATIEWTIVTIVLSLVFAKQEMVIMKTERPRNANYL